jgi:cell division protein FtsN
VSVSVTGLSPGDGDTRRMTDNHLSRRGKSKTLLIVVIAVVAAVIVLFALAFATGGSHQQAVVPATSATSG